jgi:hypothetical protein
MDYNVDSLQGTEINADSFGQGLLEHNRAHLAWLEGILNRYPELVIENCGSGGGRMDYAMLSRLQLQSMTDQENYLKLPGILVGASAAVLPEQLAIWSYPLAQGRCRSSQLQYGHDHVVPHSPERPAGFNLRQWASSGNQRHQDLQGCDSQSYTSHRAILSFGLAGCDEPERPGCARNARSGLDHAGCMAVGRG